MPTTRSPIAYHLTPSEDWRAAPPDEPFRPASLDLEGLVHLTHRMADLVDVANALYRPDPRPHVVLTVVLDRLTSGWRYDGDERYPHVYGPIDRAAIASVRPVARANDGAFVAVEVGDEGALRPGGSGGGEGWLEAAGLDATEPDDEAFEAMVFDALDGLPDEFRERLGSVAVVVEDEPTPEQLAVVGAAGLYGLYQGVPRTRWGADQVPVPSKITIFRGPHLRRYGRGPALAGGVAATVRHEVAHHFGIDDMRLHELGRH
ncbi:MAG TPA: DUF952 domain-containing protein [Candidatus Dormibacteraeota bacterium]|nr:DUF952 domain-containing protein [Candidatus Dormibacteraeota bacterium]